MTRADEHVAELSAILDTLRRESRDLVADLVRQDAHVHAAHAATLADQAAAHLLQLQRYGARVVEPIPTIVRWS